MRASLLGPSLLLALACGEAGPTVAVADPPARAAAPAASPAPSGADALLARHAEVGEDPAAALAVWLEAAILAGDPKTRDAGEAAIGALTVPFRDGQPWQQRSTARTFHDRLRTHPHVFRSYFDRATPENAYTPTAPLTLRVVSSADDGERGHRVVVASGGADLPRPVHLRKSRLDGRFYVDSFANLYLEVRPALDPAREF